MAEAVVSEEGHVRLPCSLEGQVSHLAYALAGAITRRADWDTGACHARQEVLAKAIGASERSVGRGVRELAAVGFLTITFRWADGRRLNTYRLRVPSRQLRQAPVSEQPRDQTPVPVGEGSYVDEQGFVRTDNPEHLE